jgi:hypothetical protein
VPSDVRSIGGPVVEPGQRGGHSQHLDVAQHRGGDGRIGEPGPGQRALSPALGPVDAAGG